LTSAAFARRRRASKAKTARCAVRRATARGKDCEGMRARRKPALTHPFNYTTNLKSAMP